MPGATVTSRSKVPGVNARTPVILGIHGSPRGMGSRTRMLIQWILAGAEERGALTELVDLTDLWIEPCTACQSCSLTGSCIYNDDFSSLYTRMIQADGIILGSPVYIDNISGQMKVFIDRLADAIHYQGLTGKYGCAVSTTWISGGESVVCYLSHVLNYLGVLTVGGLAAALEDSETKIYDAEDRSLDLGRKLFQAIVQKEQYPDQEEILANNRAFFARIVRENRMWRPEEFNDWVEKGWIPKPE